MTVVAVIIIVVDFVVVVVTSSMKEHKAAIFRRATRVVNSTLAVPQYSYHVKCYAKLTQINWTNITNIVI